MDFHKSLASYKSYYLNKFIDHHAFEILSQACDSESQSWPFILGRTPNRHCLDTRLQYWRSLAPTFQSHVATTTALYLLAALHICISYTNSYTSFAEDSSSPQLILLRYNSFRVLFPAFVRCPASGKYPFAFLLVNFLKKKRVFLCFTPSENEFGNQLFLDSILLARLLAFRLERARSSSFKLVQVQKSKWQIS